MQHIKKLDYKNGYLLSFILHSLFLSLIFFEFVSKQHMPLEKENFVSISLQEYVPVIEPKKTIQPTIPVKKEQPVEKKIVEKKVIQEKIIEDAILKKEIVEKQVIKPKVLEKKIIEEKIVEEKVVEETPVEKKIIEPLTAQQENVKKQITKKATSESLAKEFAKTNFEILRNLVLAHVKYPNIAKRMKKTGVVELMLTIDTYGKLIDVYVKKSSGHNILDKSALRAAKRLSSMELPIPKTKSKIMLPILYSLR